ncbi:glycosyl hydrolase [Flavitalea sp.]|nr:glycosyl hydrolase [Flavitalea sp.]
MLKWFLLLVILYFPLHPTAQLPWPEVNNTMKPWIRWWWQGSAVNKKDLLYNLELYKKAGLGGVEITPIYGIMGQDSSFINYLSKDWMEMLKYTLEQSRRLGMGVDLANGTGWPFGGPWVTEDNASKSLYQNTYTLSKGKKLNTKIQFNRPGFIRTANNKVIQPGTLKSPLIANKNQQQLSLDQLHYEENLPLLKLMAFGPDKSIIDLTGKVSKSGTLDWTAPSDKWTLIALFEGLHGKLVERAAPGGEGYAIDHFSAVATREYLKHFDSAFRNYDLKYLRSFFNDSYEVDDAKGQANWTPRFLDEFKKRKGYKLLNHLPGLFSLDSATKNAQVIYDYRSVIDELLLEHFTMNWKRWATDKGALVRNQSHGSPANTLDLYAVVDIPETEGNDILRFKFASSAGNVTGKKLVSAEAATWLNEHFLSNWADVKQAVDLFFLGGVNHIFFHGTAYSPQSVPWPGWLFYAAVHFQPVNPMWKEFNVLNNYITRIQSFLQNAKPDNDLLVYYPIADQYSKTGGPMLQHFDGMEKNFEETDFKRLSAWMLENDYSFDFYSTRQSANFQFKNGIITGGNKYQAILLPGNTYLEPGELQRLIKLCQEGAKILVYKNLPSKVPGYANHNRDQKLFDSLRASLPFTNDGTVQKAEIGKGYFLMGNDIGSLLRAGQVRKENLHTNGISFIRKLNAAGTVYMLSNTSGKKFRDWLEFSATGKEGSAAVFDPVTGSTGLLAQKKNETGTNQYFLQLDPGETIIVQIFATQKKTGLFNFYESTGPSTEIMGDWITQFIDGGPSLPSTLNSKRAMFWTAGKDTSLGNFSGTAKYRVIFTRPSDTAASWLLDLGEVKETANIMLNGKNFGGLIGPGFKIVIDKKDLLPQNNLEITVSNLMANRIIYMDRNHLPWKIFYNTNMPARKKENSKEGLFDASGWKPVPSGLGGPVTLTPLKKVMSYEL